MANFPTRELVGYVFNTEKKDTDVVHSGWHQSKHRRMAIFCFPHAFTPVCQSTMAEVSKRLPDFTALDVVPVGMSTDPLPAIGEWVKQNKILVPVFSDFATRSTVQLLTGVNQNTGAANRGVVLFNHGQVEWSIIGSDKNCGVAQQVDGLFKVLESA